MDSPSQSHPSARSDAPRISISRWAASLAFVLISALYFADTLLRASLKTFWYDELVTVLLCRLPRMSDIRAAVLQGADFNPPLLYLFTRWSQHVFGENQIATRLPAIFGFWLFAICLFLFVRRRLGNLAGLVAALLPVFTLAHWYAYEARAYGIELAWTGMMMLCWQRAREQRPLSLWVLAFWLSWLAALLTHVYAIYLLVPFLIVESMGLLGKWKPHPGILAALLLAPACVASLFSEMMRTYRASTSIGGLHVHPYEVAQSYLLSVFGPSLVLLIVLLLLLAFAAARRTAAEAATLALPSCLRPEELSLAAALVCLPLFGIVGVRLSHGPFFNRYFLPAVAGFAVLAAQVSVLPGRRAARGLVAVMVLLLTADTAVAAWCRSRHADLDQVEPVSHFAFPPNPAHPLSRDAALLHNHDPQDIAITDEHLYLYLYYYASPELRRRLVLTLPDATAFPVSAFQQQARLLHLDDERITSLAGFLRNQRDFFFYNPIDGRAGSSCLDCLQPILDDGFRLRSVDEDTDHLLEHFTRP